MYQSDRLEVWNLNPGPIQIGAQPIFNVVGRLKSLQGVRRLCYTLNNGPEQNIFFNRTNGRLGRLEKCGDFNIDTITLKDLLPQNRLAIRAYNGSTVIDEMTIPFSIDPPKQNETRFTLDLKDAQHPQEVGQIVDGKWRITKDGRGEKCLEIKKEDAGMDRIVLFGNQNWTTGYEVTARLCVTAWTWLTHNMGLLFKWNPHLQGNGKHLPCQWSTGLAYYYSHCPGLRLRLGVDVHIDPEGNKQGDYILTDAPLSRWRQRWGWVANRLLDTLGMSQYPFSQMVPGTHYRFRLRVHPDAYALTVWKMTQKEPPPQIIAPHPVDRLHTGSVGVIAYNCGLRIYEVNVVPA